MAVWFQNGPCSEFLAVLESETDIAPFGLLPVLISADLDRLGGVHRREFTK